MSVELRARPGFNMRRSFECCSSGGTVGKLMALAAIGLASASPTPFSFLRLRGGNVETLNFPKLPGCLLTEAEDKAAGPACLHPEAGKISVEHREHA